MGWPNAPLAVELDADEDDEVAYFAGKGYQQLHQNVRRRFAAYNLNVVTIKLDTDPRAVFLIFTGTKVTGTRLQAPGYRHQVTGTRLQAPRAQLSIA
jgi:hypothetical protein